MSFRRAFAAFALVALAVCACEQIIGLDKYCGSDCADSGAFDGGPPDALADASSDAPSDAVVIPDVVDEATSWANWPIENPLPEIQAEAGPAATSLAAFTDAGAVVVDQITNLTWSLAPATEITIEDAAAYCASLTPSGFRLPTRIELVTLLDTTRSSAPYIEAPFVQPLLNATLGGANLWTSSYYRPIENGNLTYWFVNLNTGEVYQSGPTQAGVLCVR